MPTLTLNLDRLYMDALDALAAEQGMSKTAVLRAALRVYQTVHQRAKLGQQLAFTKDGKTVSLLIPGLIAADIPSGVGGDQQPAPSIQEADTERLCWAVRQFVKLVTAGNECRLQLTVGAQSFFIGMESLPEDEAAHFAGQFVFALAGIVAQVTHGVAPTEQEQAK